MEIVTYLIIMVAMCAIEALCNLLDPWRETPLRILSVLESGIFAIMFMLAVVVGIVANTGVEVSA